MNIEPETEDFIVNIGAKVPSLDDTVKAIVN